MGPPERSLTTADSNSPALTLPEPPVEPTVPRWPLPLALLLLLVALVAVAFGASRLAWLIAPAAFAAAAAWWMQRHRQRQWAEFHTLAKRRSLQIRTALDEASRAEAEYRRNQAIGAHDVIAAVAHGVNLPTDAPVAIAVGSAQWAPPGVTPTDPDLAAALQANDRLHGVPLGIDPAKHIIGLAGPRPTALAAARHVITAVLTRSNRPDIDLRLSPSAQIDWKAPWPEPAGSTTPVYTLVDGDSSGRRPEAGLVLSDSTVDLLHDPDVTITIDDEGRAEVTVSASGITSDRVVPVGITAEQMCEILRALPLNPAPTTGSTTDGSSAQRTSRTPNTSPAPASSADIEQVVTGPILITAPEPDLARGQLTAIAVDVCQTAPADSVVLVLDLDAHSLHGLTSLARPIHYATAGSTGSVETAVAAWTKAQSAGHPGILLAHDLGRLLQQLAAADRIDLANDVVGLLRDAAHGHGFAAVAEPPDSRLPTRIANRFPVQIIYREDRPWLTGTGPDRPLTRHRISVDEVAEALRHYN